MRSRLILFFTFLLPFSCIAQDVSYARSVVDTLASPSMHGRGYVNGGDKIAAKYISEQFRQFGLVPFNIAGLYTQSFSFPVNTFPSAMEVSFLSGDRAAVHLAPGQDFIVNCDAPSVKGKFLVELVDSALVADESKFELFKSSDHHRNFVMVDTVGVRTKRELSYLTDLIRYRNGVRGVIVPVKPNAMTESCSKLLPMDISTTQSTTPLIFVAYKFRKETRIQVNIKAKFISKYSSQNIAGCIRGSVKPDSFIVFTAHYDHLGQMGANTYFPGANDNASGMAMLLTLAKYYSQPEHRPAYSIAFIAFSAEEVGLVGSAYYIKHPLFPPSQIRFLVNMDILGTGDEGITVVNGKEFVPEFNSLKNLNDSKHYLTAVWARGKAAISDHYFFTEAGVKCFYIYTLGGLKAYHDTCDRSETLPLTKFAELEKLLIDFTELMM